MPDFDLVVIGAGAAGLSTTALSAALGLRIALIERAEMGGDCLNWGCVPSKALLAAAHAAAAARHAGRFGVRVSEPEIDWPAVRAHVRGAIARIAPTDSEARFRGMGVEVIRASAHFTAPDEIEARGRRLTFRRCVIAAGSSAVVPDIPGLGPVPWLTNETIFDLEEKPEHLLILGGGPIGLEMAQAHARLGCRVTVIEAGRIAGRDDPELAEGLRRVLVREGVTLLEGARLASVEPDRPGLTAVLEDGTRIAGSHLLLAVGRAPRLKGLDLQAGNIEATPRGIATDEGLRSLSNRRVWAVGDIADPRGIGPRAFTHVASQHAGVLARRMLFRLPARVDYAALPRVTYTGPELAQVGMTEAEALEAGLDPRPYRFPLPETDRAVAEGIEDGLVKLVVNPKGRLLGAGVLGPHAGEMAGVFGLMIGRKLPLSALAGLVLPYPTLAEAAKRAAGDFYAPKFLSTFSKRLVGLLWRLP
ncbi:dihydrolipoamide dehydrogenase [Falsiroseomonas bella]|uniref:Dihydrolipoamide dehydrogenase n=1 Tax=Falsiroseomonas bella TaxID=2184016 RepID=A0A317FIS4_9PROT|nr:FAD-dependent oxidoreductase [Falsiroseomonas bella]PWS37476.1 dihydrolipoamide dehydrogenase [Falsiroseomonas bella]